MTREIDYLNARIRGMSGRLLSEELIRSLFSASAPEIWSATLRDTPYADYLALGTDSMQLYRAVDASIVARTHYLDRIAEGRPAQAVKICLAQWDLHNLLTLTSGLHHRASPIDILSGTLAGGILDYLQLEALAHCKNTKEASDLLALWEFPYHLAFRQAMGTDQSRFLGQKRFELVRSYTQILVENARKTGYGVLMRYLRDRIDQTNMMTALMWRTLPTDRDPSEFHIAGGESVNVEVFRSVLAAGTILEAFSELPTGWIKKSMRDAALDPELGPELGERTSALGQTMETEIIYRYTRPSARDPMGIELLLAYLLRLRREGSRLKLTLMRLLLDIPEDLFVQIAGRI